MRPWLGPGDEQAPVELETLDYVTWFNNDRPHEALDDLTPTAAEELQ